MMLVCKSSSWDAKPLILPSSNTSILSAPCILDILCEIIILVVPGILVANASLILASVAVSTALVESSSISTFGFLRSALAIQSLCFCPPDTLLPP